MKQKKNRNKIDFFWIELQLSHKKKQYMPIKLFEFHEQFMTRAFLKILNTFITLKTKETKQNFANVGEQNFMRVGRKS